MLLALEGFNIFQPVFSIRFQLPANPSTLAIFQISEDGEKA
jgi:hypothetical protein